MREIANTESNLSKIEEKNTIDSKDVIIFEGINGQIKKIEIPKDTSTDGYQSFSNLNAFADAQLSKRILGGTGVSDEKSFVGSAELHERMLQYRIKVDKLIFKFYMNEEIIPRLVKLSSVYAPLANLTGEPPITSCSISLA